MGPGWVKLHINKREAIFGKSGCNGIVIKFVTIAEQKELLENWFEHVAVYRSENESESLCITASVSIFRKRNLVLVYHCLHTIINCRVIDIPFYKVETI
jgi:hypothetical protein